MKTNLVHNNVFRMVKIHGDVMPTFIIPRGLRFNTGAAIKYLEDVIQIWIQRVAVRKLNLW